MFKILVLEDDQDLNHTVCSFLNASGYEFAKTVRSLNEDIPLTTREFNIIYKLLSYPGKTFTRTQLMDEFWDADTNTAPRAVDVYMTKFRGKFEGCGEFELKTVHGLGYKAVVK